MKMSCLSKRLVNNRGKLCANRSLSIRGTSLTLMFQLLMLHKTLDVRIDLGKIPHAGSKHRLGSAYTIVTKNDTI